MPPLHLGLAHNLRRGVVTPPYEHLSAVLGAYCNEIASILAVIILF